MQRVLTTVVLLGLLLASAAAFAITEHLKLIKSPIYAPQVTKKFSPAAGEAAISFKLRHADSVTVTIVDSGGTVVDTLGEVAVPKKNATVTFHWNGRTTTGLAPNGAQYRPQVALKNDRRTITMPNTITIDSVAPTVESATDGGGLLISGGSHGVVIHYVFSEKAHAVVYLNGRRIILGRGSRETDKVKWNGKAGGKRLPPGRYVVEVGAVDLAGNETPAARRKRLVVRIRDIALGESSIRVAPHARFTVTVRTGAPRYTWRFAREHGTGTTKSLQLRAPKQPGRYRLVVREHGHATTATVDVGRK